MTPVTGKDEVGPGKRGAVSSSYSALGSPTQSIPRAKELACSEKEVVF